MASGLEQDRAKLLEILTKLTADFTYQDELQAASSSISSSEQEPSADDEQVHGLPAIPGLSHYPPTSPNNNEPPRTAYSFATPEDRIRAIHAMAEVSYAHAMSYAVVANPNHPKPSEVATLQRILNEKRISTDLRKVGILTCDMRWGKQFFAVGPDIHPTANEMAQYYMAAQDHHECPVNPFERVNFAQTTRFAADGRATVGADPEGPVYSMGPAVESEPEFGEVEPGGSEMSRLRTFLSFQIPKVSAFLPYLLVVALALLVLRFESELGF